MKKEDITLLAQLLTAMQDATDKLEKAYEEKDMEEIRSAKKEILNFQEKIDKLI